MSVVPMMRQCSFPGIFVGPNRVALKAASTNPFVIREAITLALDVFFSAKD
jgi:hypothetical protein